MPRRPARTRAQKLHDKQQRALLTLRKTAVRWSIKSNTDSDGSDDGDGLINSLTDMQAAADRYTETLSARERRKLLR
jgi:hypothetical protein